MIAAADGSLLGTSETNPHLELAKAYLKLALGPRRREASQLILDAVEQGTSVRDVYLHVFQPVQHEIGRLWQLNRITIAQEHLCTAITQLVMSQLYPRIFAGERRGLRLVATCLGGELHEIGVRMVADFFEMSGWDTFYLGANTPAAAVVEEAVAVDAQLVGLSVTLEEHLPQAAALIQAVHSEPRCPGVKIIVGGHPFNEDEELYRRLGADGTAVDAEQAVALGARLVGA